MDVFLIRMETGDHGTFGIIACQGRKFYCAEPPWKNNQRNVSCIPEGTYQVKRYVSRKFGRVYMLENTKPRTYILTHTGNLAGDLEKGLITHTHGCIMIGSYFGNFKGQKAILASRTAFRHFDEIIGGNNFSIQIINLF